LSARDGLLVGLGAEHLPSVLLGLRQRLGTDVLHADPRPLVSQHRGNAGAHQATSEHSDDLDGSGLAATHFSFFSAVVAKKDAAQILGSLPDTSFANARRSALEPSLHAVAQSNADAFENLERRGIRRPVSS
jgi:hypothetical protein